MEGTRTWPRRRFSGQRRRETPRPLEVRCSAPQRRPDSAVTWRWPVSSAWRRWSCCEIVNSGRGPASCSGLWSSTFSSLSPQISAEGIRDALASVRVEAVFTAHPTEARRVSALEMYREVLAALPLERPIQAMHARERNAVAAVLERLYRSGEVRVRKPEVADERAFVIDIVTRVLPAAVEESVGRMRTASEAAGVPIGDAEPRVSFGTWVGGDRDGHPLVTGEVTRASLAAYRRAAIELQRDSLVRLGARLGLSALRQPAPADLVDAIARLSDTLGPRATAAMARNADEPWRTLVNLVLLRLPAFGGPAEPWQYERPEQLAADLRVLGHSLESLGAERIARAEVLPVLRQVRAFGFHLVALDLRQNSRVTSSRSTACWRRAGTPGGVTRRGTKRNGARGSPTRSRAAGPSFREVPSSKARRRSPSTRSPPPPIIGRRTAWTGSVASS